MRQSRWKVIPAVTAMLLLCGCSTVSGWFEEPEKPLPGERISILELQKDLEPDDAALSATGFVAPSPWQNEFWPQAGGYPNHAMQHLALPEKNLERQWSVRIGEGGSSRLPLSAQPVIVDGKVFTLDADSTVSAFDIKDGKRLWSTGIRPAHEEDPVIAGGLAYAGGHLYVTGGYGELLSLSPDDGGVMWRRNTKAPSRAAPTVLDQRVFVTTIDNRVLSFAADSGTLNWEHTALPESAGLVGAASPGANYDIVVPAFSSGEIFALRIENGSVAWSENLAPRRTAAGLASLPDITGLPVLDKGYVIAVSAGGRMVVIDERTGSRVWQREIGSTETPWVAGNHIFVTTTENELVALGRDNGVVRWVFDLDSEAGDDERPQPWSGPLYAGGRLFVIGADGNVVEVSPDNGEKLRSWSLDKAVSISPVVAGGTLYVLADDGTLFAYR